MSLVNRSILMSTENDSSVYKEMVDVIASLASISYTQHNRGEPQ